MTLKQLQTAADKFVEKWLGKKADFDGAYAGQCVDLFRFYVQDVLRHPQPKGVNGAKDFWTNYEGDPNLNKYFKKITNTPTFVPIKGDVVVWNGRAGGGYGHIAIFLEGDVNSFISFDQNWPTLSKCTKTKHDYKNVYGVFRPNVTEETPKPTPSKPLKDMIIDFDDAEGKRHTVGFYVYEHGVEKRRAEEAEKELKEVRSKSTEEISRLNGSIRDLQSQLVEKEKMTQTKTMTQHLETGAKYSGISVLIAGTITTALLAYYPELQNNTEIPVAIQSIVTVVVNLIAIRLFKN